MECGKCASLAPCGQRAGEKRIRHRRTALAGTKRRIQEIRECEIPWSDGNGYIQRRRIHHQSRICFGWRNLPNSAQRKHIPHRHLHGNKHGNEPRLALGSGRRGNFGAYRNRNFWRTPILGVKKLFHFKNLMYFYIIFYKKKNKH